MQGAERSNLAGGLPLWRATGETALRSTGQRSRLFGRKRQNNLPYVHVYFSHLFTSNKKLKRFSEYNCELDKQKNAHCSRYLSLCLSFTSSVCSKSRSRRQLKFGAKHVTISNTGSRLLEAGISWGTSFYRTMLCTARTMLSKGVCPSICLSVRHDPVL